MTSSTRVKLLQNERHLHERQLLSGHCGRAFIDFGLIVRVLHHIDGCTLRPVKHEQSVT